MKFVVSQCRTRILNVKKCKVFYCYECTDNDINHASEIRINRITMGKYVTNKQAMLAFDLLLHWLICPEESMFGNIKNYIMPSSEDINNIMIERNIV